MEARIVIVILLVRFSQQMIVMDEVDPVNRAISDLVKRQDQSNIDIITFGTQTFDDLISTVTSAHKSLIRFRILKANENQAFILFLNESSLLLFDSFEVFKHFAGKFDYCNREVSARRRHVVYYPKTSFASFQTFPGVRYCMFWATFVIDNANNDWIYLTKLDYYHPGNCNQITFASINVFSRSELRWLNQTFFTEHFKNFNNCTMNVATGAYHQKLFGVKKLDVKYTKKLLDVLKQTLNFTPVYDDGTREIDLTIWMAFQNDGKKYQISRRFDFLQVKFMIAKGQVESPFLKLTKPFDTEVWIYLGCSMFIGLLTIQIVLRCRRQARNFVFGRNVTTPTLNMWQIFNGLGMITLPSRNFARFILILYIIFCLIVRVGYQAKLYQFLQQDFRIDDIHTIDDLLQRNFTFFVLDALKKHVSDILKM